MLIAQLQHIMPLAGARAEKFLQPLNDAMLEFGINSGLRQAAFLAQIAHESGELRYTRELASGDAYERRADLGNTEPGDGRRFKGRGLIQITGRANYRACSVALYGDPDILCAHPELLEQTIAACRSAAWFWWAHGLNPLADNGQFSTITRRINGGLNGYDARVAYWQRAQEVMR